MYTARYALWIFNAKIIKATMIKILYWHNHEHINKTVNIFTDWSQEIHTPTLAYGGYVNCSQFLSYIP